jgi:WD40 repeat protein
MGGWWQPERAMVGHGCGMPPPAFSPDNRRLLTVSVDHTSKVWDLSPDERSVDELEALAQFLAGRRVDEGGGVVPLSQSDLPKLYRRFHPSRKSDSALSGSP